MKKSVFASLEKGLASLAKEIDSGGTDLLLVDVFDTLVHRRCEPDGPLVTTARWLDRELIRRGIRASADALTAYHQAYAELARINKEAGYDEEVFTKDLYLAWVFYAVGEQSGNADLALLLAETMKRYELWSCFPNSHVVRALRNIKSKGLRLVYVSDMYLGGACIQAILKSCGLDDLFDAGFVSADYALLKRTGRLFDLVLEREGVKASRAIHMGDNELGDGEMPLTRGIRSIVLQDRRLVKRNHQLRYDHHCYKRWQGWGGVMASEFARSTIDETGVFPELYAKRVLGPVYAAFVHRIAERCLEENISQVFFLAREGLFLREIFLEIAPLVFRDKPVPRTFYLCVSRLSAFYLASSHFGLREVALGLANGPRTIRDLLAPLQMSVTDLSNVAARYGHDDIDAVLPDNFLSWPPFISMLSDPEIIRHLEVKRVSVGGLLERYLEQSGFFDSERVAIVDVGWAGQIQESLYLGLRHREDCPQLFGIYLGMNLVGHWRKGASNWMEWVLCDQSHLDWNGSAALQFPQAFEAITRAPHGTVIGYVANRDLMVSALLKEDGDPGRQAEIFNEEMIALFQEGIRKYVHHYRRCAEMFEIQASDSIPYAKEMLARMIRFPTAKEADLLLGLQNVSDLGSSRVFAMGSRRNLSIFRLRDLKASLGTSFWKQGTLAWCGGRWLQVLWAIIKDAKSYPHKSVPLGPGIVVHEYEQCLFGERSRQMSGDESSALVAAMNAKSREFVDRAREKGTQLAAHELTAPITASEVLLSWMSYRIVRIKCRVLGRHVPYRDGISMQILMKRTVVCSLMAMPALRVGGGMPRLTLVRNALRGLFGRQMLRLARLSKDMR